MKLGLLLLSTAMLCFTAHSSQMKMEVEFEGQTALMHQDTHAFLQLGQRLEAEVKLQDKLSTDAFTYQQMRHETGYKVQKPGDFLAGINPPLKEDERIKVVFLRASLQKSAAWYLRMIYKFFNANHGGIGFIRVDSGIDKGKEGGAIEVQMCAEYGFGNAVIPSIVKLNGEGIPQDVDDTIETTFDPDAGKIGPDGLPILPHDKLTGASLSWNNTVEIDVLNKIDMTYWDELIEIGHITGRELMLLDCWLPQWLQAVPYYSFWSVVAPYAYNDKVVVESKTCWDFVLDCMSYLKKVEYVHSEWNTEVVARLRKSNTKLTTTSAAVPLKWSEMDERKRRQVLEYYAASFVNRVMGAHLDSNKRIAYAYDRNIDTYYEVQQVSPYYAYSWETVDWSLHPPMTFSEVCGEPTYRRKTYNPHAREADIRVHPAEEAEEASEWPVEADVGGERKRLRREDELRRMKEKMEEKEINDWMNAL